MGEEDLDDHNGQLEDEGSQDSPVSVDSPRVVVVILQGLVRRQSQTHRNMDLPGSVAPRGQTPRPPSVL